MSGGGATGPHPGDTHAPGEPVDEPHRSAVLDVLARFAHGIDGRDWALYRSVFTDQIELDYSSYRSGSVGRQSAQEWVDRARRMFPGLTASQHSLVNPWLTRDGHRVVVRTSMRADHFLDGQRYTLGGSYTHRLAEVGDGWRIEVVTLTVTFTEGDPSLLTRAAALVAAG